ncbi:hypothetical protein [Microbispora sp. NBRC 16548]|uniref:hypothetical protein n=1 Tax=Microbispora sp. NBRC 16548 TaxID=3030994 RepID=UPI0016223BDA|nr:hypothetical protein [Microbispora sp. NBRC 16548]
MAFEEAERRNRRRGPAAPAGHDPLDPAWGLDAVAAALYEQGFPQPVLHQLCRADRIGEPAGRPFLVGPGRLTEPEGLADLRPDPKGVVVLVPSRRQRDYDDRWLTVAKEEANATSG